MGTARWLRRVVQALVVSVLALVILVVIMSVLGMNVASSRISGHDLLWAVMNIARS
jgi:hypothetical protein